jgi:hypothetical protein
MYMSEKDRRREQFNRKQAPKKRKNNSKTKKRLNPYLDQEELSGSLTEAVKEYNGSP